MVELVPYYCNKKHGHCLCHKCNSLLELSAELSENPEVIVEPSNSIQTSSLDLNQSGWFSNVSRFSPFA
jgi:Fe2+ or Zn2+ uptake regulation protein